ncbi:MAG TPA: transposase [Pyrinomonadaceae bacterium]|nr:transposase [Pyrinomonadaceae bacterium]
MPPHYHLVFSTKDRAPLIGADWRDKLHAYLGGIVGDLRGVAIVVGVIEDHVHLLVGLKPTHCLSDILRDINSELRTFFGRIRGSEQAPVVLAKK